MGQIDNLNKSKLPEVLQQVRTQGVGAPMNSAAIGRGGIEVYQNGTINVSDGNLIVNGTATISGILNADGTVTLSGTITISGPLTISGATGITGPLTVTGATHLNGTTDVAGDTTVTGDFDVDGPMKTTGTLSVEGVTTLKNDLNVTGGGEIIAGNTKISPSASNGGVEFVSGGGIGGSGGVVAIKGTGNAGLITDTTASIFAATNSVDVSPTAVTINGPLKVAGITNTTEAANVYCDPVTKQFYIKP